MASTQSTGISPEEEVSLLDRSVCDLKFHFDCTPGFSAAGFLAFIVDIESATAKLRAFYESGQR